MRAQVGPLPRLSRPKVGSWGEGEAACKLGSKGRARGSGGKQGTIGVSWSCTTPTTKIKCVLEKCVRQSVKDGFKTFCILDITDHLGRPVGLGSPLVLDLDPLHTAKRPARRNTWAGQNSICSVRRSGQSPNVCGYVLLHKGISPTKCGLATAHNSGQPHQHPLPP